MPRLRFSRWCVHCRWSAGCPMSFASNAPNRYNCGKDQAFSVARRREVQERMRKTLLLFLLLPFMAVASQAQESRQDISVSVTGIFPPFITGNAVQQSATDGLGGLVSYRYMLTPRSGLELNYQYAQNAQKYYTSFNNVR